jgi:undecaprenyl pyrophosphate phosphatase UppP
MKEKLTFVVTTMVSFTLCVVIVGMVFALCVGLFDKEVNNEDIFKLLAPAFQTIIGGFIGLLAGIKFSNSSEGNDVK